jgi:hypothetical protein
MRFAIVIAGAMILAAPALASDLGNQAPPKPPSVATPNVHDPARQGGDTIATAFPIAALPYLDTGTTTGYADDYDEVCPYAGSTSPDVVYAYMVPVDELVVIDLCGSSFDTKVYVYDEDLHLVACNDDYYIAGSCGVYTSKIARADLEANRTYYIVVDGYGTAHGQYVLAVSVLQPCPFDCPAGSVPEGEPPLHDGYVDLWNGGCFVEPDHPFQVIIGNDEGMLTLCGVSGRYTSQGNQLRDTDWFTLTMGSTGAIVVTIDAEVSTGLFELLPQDCATVGVAQMADAECGEPATLTITGYEPGATVWIWVGWSFWDQLYWADNDYDYALWFSGLEAGVATEPTTWSALKALYD